MKVDVKKKLLAVLKKKKVMRVSDFGRLLPHRSLLRRMDKAGEVFYIGSGIYAHHAIDPFSASIVAASRIYPKALISNLTALVLHGLSDEVIERVDIDIERGSSIRNKAYRVHRVPKNRLTTGVTVISVYGVRIRTYNRERALCEAYRLDPGGAIFFKALKRYFRSGKQDIDRIAKYDAILGTKVLSHARQELADA